MTVEAYVGSPDPQQLNGEAFAARFELERAYEKQLEDNIMYAWQSMGMAM